MLQIKIKEKKTSPVKHIDKPTDKSIDKTKVILTPVVKRTILTTSVPIKTGLMAHGVLIKDEKEIADDRWFITSDEHGNFFCGYRKAYPYWCDKISEAKELQSIHHFNTLVRWHKHLKLKQEFL